MQVGRGAALAAAVTHCRWYALLGSPLHTLRGKVLVVILIHVLQVRSGRVQLQVLPYSMQYMLLEVGRPALLCIVHCSVMCTALYSNKTSMHELQTIRQGVQRSRGLLSSLHLGIFSLWTPGWCCIHLVSVLACFAAIYCSNRAAASNLLL
jgi:hypothetical protein